MILSGGPVRIVADDLTGALDAAAPFARPGQPVGLVLHATDIPDRRVLTISSESRDSSESEATAATTRACDVLGMPDADAQMLWFHKVDSVLRGHPFAATGGRILANLAKLLATAGKGRGLISICAAGGQGVTVIVER